MRDVTTRGTEDTEGKAVKMTGMESEAETSTADRAATGVVLPSGEADAGRASENTAQEQLRAGQYCHNKKRRKHPTTNAGHAWTRGGKWRSLRRLHRQGGVLRFGRLR